MKLTSLVILLAAALPSSAFATYRQTVRKVHTKPKVEVVPDQYIATTRDTGVTEDAVRNLPGVRVISTVHAVHGLYHVEIKDKKVLAAIKAKKHKHLASVEPVYIYRALPIKSKSSLRVSEATPPVNDPMWGNLWGMRKIGAPQAWNSGTGSANGPIIAIVDTGIDYNHPDLAANVFSHGFNAITGLPDGLDDNDHGSHVSGTIAAVGNNGVGVVGVNWHARLVPSKFLDASGAGTSADSIKAVYWAVEHGAKVLNNSWGGGGYSQALQNAISAACKSGAIFVAAAGNDGNDNDATPSYPASYNLPCVISVAAVDQNDQFADFSNYGKSVFIAAPGVGITSTVIGGKYDTYDGTSMATPHVTGAVALLLTKYPNLTAAQVKQKLINSADPLPCSSDGKCVAHGRLNVGKLLSQ